MIEGDDNVSSTTTTNTTTATINTTMISSFQRKGIHPGKLRHFAMQRRSSINHLARINQDSILIYPGIYFCLDTTFTLPPLDYVIALICNVPVERHGLEHCQLLKGMFTPCEYTYALILTNITDAIHIVIPDYYDLRYLIDIPWLKIEICHLNLSELFSQ